MMRGRQTASSPAGHYGEPGMQLFVNGREEGNDTRPSRYPARQTREASEAVARLNQVIPTGDLRPAKPGRHPPGRFS